MSGAGLPLPVVAVSGTPAQCGRDYGRAAADLIRGNVAAYLDWFAAQANLDPGQVRRYGRQVRELTTARLPRIAQMLDGVAEGSRTDVGEIYAVNARTELLYGTPMTECTALGVLDTHTASGHTVLAQNWDWNPAHRAYALVLVTRDEYGFAVATLAEAGMLAKAGVNSAGVGLCLNMLGSDRDGQRPGVPYHVLIRAVLEQPTLTHAIRTACATPRASSLNLVIGQCAGGPGAAGPGEIIDVELVPGDAGFRHPVDGYLTHANHLECPLPVRDTLKELGSSSFFRSARARRLLAPAAAAGKVGDDDIAAVLTDHLSYPLAICRHVDESEPLTERSETVSSVLIDLDERRLQVTDGPPCAAAYGSATLDELLAAV